MPTVNPTQLQSKLKGINYPATKDDLINYVEMNNENDDRVMNVLNEIPDKEYESPAELNEEVGKLV